MNRSRLLQSTNNGRDVFQYYLGVMPQPGRNITNPFLPEKQKTPSFNVFRDSHGEWRYNDFATAQSGSCLDLVMMLRGLNIPEALKLIEHDLGLFDAAISTSHQPAVNLSKTMLPTIQPRVLDAVYRVMMTLEEAAFWQQYGIDEPTLHRFGVRAVESYRATSKKTGQPYTIAAKPGQPLFAYRFENEWVKMYAPNTPSYKFSWPTGQPPCYVFGLAQLPKSGGSAVLLTAGEKDALTLNAHGYAAITIGSETASIPDGLLDTLYGMGFGQVIICYDADETGRRRSQELAAEHQLPWVELPTELAPYGKDVSDFFRAVYRGELSQELFDNALANLCYTEPATNNSLSKAPSGSIRLRTAQERMVAAQQAPPLIPLWGMLWESPGIAILAGEPGAGKSLLAVLIAHAVSSDTISLLGLPCSANTKVLYYDFELTDRQFEKRFDGLPFTNNLIIGEFNPNACDIEFTFEEIRINIEQTGAKLLIIDNITALALKTTADADASIAVMRGLKKLQIEQGISSLILAHPPKLPVGIPLSINHVGGSKNIPNFADSVLFIARSTQGPNTRYIKQVKNRTDEILSGVLVCEIDDAQGYLDLTLVGQDEERNHLAHNEESNGKPEPESSAEVEKLRTLWIQNPTAPQATLAQQVGRSVGWVNKYLKRFRSAPSSIHVHAGPHTVNGVNVNATKPNNTLNQSIHPIHDVHAFNASDGVNDESESFTFTEDELDCLFVNGCTTNHLLTELQAHHSHRGEADKLLAQLQKQGIIEPAPSGNGRWRVTSFVMA